MTTNTRLERDSMGEMEVPATALYGASTQRAVLNFPVGQHKMPEGFIRSVGLLKYACAQANLSLGLLNPDKAVLISEVAERIYKGELLEHFPVHIFQTGSATSTNMNCNEVIANQISLQQGKPIGSKDPVHPNDDVNMGQSSNDTMPSVLHISVAMGLKNKLAPALKYMHQVLLDKVTEFNDVIKIGRTHLMDATPLTLGQEFSGYAAQIGKAIIRIFKSIDSLKELAIGGTAVGTGINSHPEFSKLVCQILSEKTGLGFQEASNHFEAQGARDDSVEVAGQLSTIACSLTKIANDIRWMGSGPRAGLFELSLPAVQPGSSIMPGKVNPVICETLIQSCLYTHGMTSIVTNCGRDGQFELNVTIPLIAYALHETIDVLTDAVRVFTEKCLIELRANKAICDHHMRNSLMLVTALNPHIGYDKAAHVAKKAFANNTTLKAVLLEEKLMDEATIDKALDPQLMIHSHASQ